MDKMPPTIQQILIDQVGIDAIQIFNVAMGHDRNMSPCTCHVCACKMDKVSQWLKEYDERKLASK